MKILLWKAHEQFHWAAAITHTTHKVGLLVSILNKLYKRNTQVYCFIIAAARWKIFVCSLYVNLNEFYFQGKYIQKYYIDYYLYLIVKDSILYFLLDNIHKTPLLLNWILSESALFISYSFLLILVISFFPFLLFVFF